MKKTPRRRWFHDPASKPWFLTHPNASGPCRGRYACEAPATGHDSTGRALCCGDCLTRDGCRCGFLANQKRIAEEMPLTADLRRQRKGAPAPEACP